MLFLIFTFLSHNKYKCIHVYNNEIMYLRPSACFITETTEDISVVSYVNLDRQHNTKDVLLAETKIDVMVSLLVYCKQVYATCFDLYLGHHQANSIKHKLIYLNLVTLLWIHIMQFL
jgi:hypothetical protein